MRLLLSLFILIGVLFKGHSQGIQYDNAFANNGILLIPSANTSELVDFDVNTFDNDLFMAGTTSQGGGSGIYRLTISKSNLSGILDSQFGINGVSSITIAHSEYPLSIKALNNGKVLVSGSAYLGPTPNGPGLHIGFIIRLNTNGSLDTTFADNGVYKLDNIGSEFSKIVVLNDNSIIISGNVIDQGALLKLSENGILDVNFGVNGIKYLSTTNFNFVVRETILTNNNELISVGTEFSDMSNLKAAFCKTDLQGNLVPNFGTNGFVISDLYSTIPYTTEMLTTIKKAPNNNYFIGGFHSSNVILKIDDNGNFDPNFATYGVLTHSFPFIDFDLQNDDQILIVGNKSISTYNSGYSIIRFNNDGILDNTFNNGQSFDIDISPADDYVQCAKFLAPDKILIGGSSYDQNIAKSTLVKLSINNSLSVSNAEKDSIYIYPNPFTDKIVINQAHNMKNIFLFDATGKRIGFKQIDEAILIDNTIPNGLYFLSIEFIDGQHITRKLVKE